LSILVLINLKVCRGLISEFVSDKWKTPKRFKAPRTQISTE